MSDPSTRASDPGVSAWVSANAGSGKTYTLANRVARLLLADAKPHKILCLTFTRAAAAEMQDRLFRQLGEWAMLDDARLAERIAEIGGVSDDLPKARRLFAQALETPGRLKVLTLHAFCQIVLTRFPLEAGVPPGFEVLEEQTAHEMIAEARQRVLERAGAGDAALAQAVTRLAVEAGEFRLGQLLDAALGGDRRRLDRLLAADETPAMLARRAHGVADDEYSIAVDFCGALARDIAILEAAKAWLASGAATDVKYAGYIAAALAATDEEARFAALHRLFFDSKGLPRSKLATAPLQRARPDLLAFLTTMQTNYCAAQDRRRAARAAALAEAALTIIAAVYSAYNTAKRRAGMLDYEDLIVATRNLLSKSGAAQWVLYKLDGGIDHVLIDEAQDTSPEQWEIVRSLTEAFFDGERPRTIFAVGDEKQSIFSFQGADPSLFQENRLHFAARLQQAGLALLDQPLITSRRSAPQILEFVDKVFESAAARSGLTFGGAAIRHEAHRQLAQGGVEFWPALQPLAKEEIDPWLPVDAVQDDSPAARLAQQVAAKIEGWLRSGAQLPGRDRPIAPRDIMILLPRREPFGGEVIRQLKQRDIPVAGADRIVLTQQIAVMDLMALGRFVLQGRDDLNLAALLRSPLCGVSEEALYVLAQPRGAATLWQALTAARGMPDYAPAHAFLADMLKLADHVPPFEFYSHALSARGGRARLLARLGAEAADAIDEFLSLALAQERNQTPSLQGFLDWIERGDTEIKRDMDRGRDEVRVMTVHGAKGLEADIVILPDTTGQAGGLNRHEGLLFTGDGALFPLSQNEAPRVVQQAKAAAREKVLKEHRRLLYVALTRARDRLYVCGFAGKKGPQPDSWYALTEAAARELGVKVRHGDGEILAHGSQAMETGARKDAAPPPAALPGWTQTPAPPEPARPRLIRPSDAMPDSEVRFAPQAASRYARGLVIHALLARLPEIAPERRAAVAEAFAAAKQMPDPKALAAEVLAVLDHPQFAAAFGPQSQAEAGLVAELPQLGDGARINGRMDRLAVSDDEVLILDFKTNRPPPSQEQDVPAIYLGQMTLYRAAAAQVFPGRRIVCGLLFTDGPRLMRLSDAILDRQWADLAARLGT